MSEKKLGSQTFALACPPSLLGWASVVGKKEGDGPLGANFDLISQDSYFGEKTWEKAERAMQRLALTQALEKSGLAAVSLDALFGGDLNNQCIATSYAARSLGVPFFGLYGACSTMAESLALAALLLDGGFGTQTAAIASSHFCTAERQYRTPLEYGGQRTPTAQWTATASGAVILGQNGPGPYVTHVTAGKIVDRGIKDANNMGAAMAPAAYDTLKTHFSDTGRHRHRRSGQAGQGTAGGAVSAGRGGVFQLQRLRANALRSGTSGCPLRRLRLRVLRLCAHRGTAGRG